MFYRRLQKQFPVIGRRFIFITGNPTSATAGKIKREGLNVLLKPFSLSEIRQKVYDLMECNTRGDCGREHLSN
ncbi:MAG: hypothetical protein JJV98_20375 [Desulfosarcina sp.]|nr:hypothetical protein [Desulfobacterales bacterium]